MRVLILFAISTILAGCVSTEEAQRRAAAEQEAHAVCQRNSKTHLAFAKCENALIFASAPTSSSNGDLVYVLAAKREAIADRLDRNLITEADARLEVATTYSQLLSTANQRNVQTTQIALQAAAVEAANRPQPTLRCTSQRVINNIQTICQ